METAALAEVVSRTRDDNGAAAGATLEISLGQIARHMARQAQQERDLNRAIRAIPMPPVLFPVVTGALTQPPTVISQLGPEDGQVWDIRRVTLAGWTTADAAVNVNLFRELLSTLSGQPQNRLRKFNDSAPGNETWSPGGGLILHSPDGLLITGTGFTTTTGITVSIEGVAIDARWEARYLL